MEGAGFGPGQRVVVVEECWRGGESGTVIDYDCSVANGDSWLVRFDDGMEAYLMTCHLRATGEWAGPPLATWIERSRWPLP
jgi:hypothetical protein